MVEEVIVEVDATGGGVEEVDMTRWNNLKRTDWKLLCIHQVEPEEEL